MRQNLTIKNNKLIILIIMIATLFLGGFFVRPVKAATLPEAPRTFYYDGIELLNSETKSLVTNKNNYYKQTGKEPQVIVAAIKTTGNQTVDEYASDLFSKWQIGQADEDNGILILYAENDGQRNVRIEVGYGLEGAVTDSQAGSILRANSDLLKSGSKSQVNKGLQQTFNAVVTLIDKEYGYKLDKNSLTDAELKKATEGDKRDFPSAIVIGFIIFVAISLFGAFSGRGKGPRGPGGGGSIPWWLLFMGSGFGSRGDDYDDDDDDHFGGFGGFGGGGGFSGGGGSSGGGGASI